MRSQKTMGALKKMAAPTAKVSEGPSPVLLFLQNQRLELD
jgi:hypothetical protein